MNKKGRLFLLVLTGLLWVSGQDSFAQLLEDRNKLKTVKKKYFKPIIEFNRNIKTKQKGVRVEKPYPVKYSRLSTPKLYRVNPRYSKPAQIVKYHPKSNQKHGYVTIFSLYGKQPPKYPQGQGGVELITTDCF